MKKHILKLGLIATIIIAFSSCGPGAVVVSSRPVTPVYVRPGYPGSGYVWVDGDWLLRGNRYVYRQGYWGRPGRGHSYWAPGHWKKTRRGSYWIPGYWR
jgi:hypothetical protein